jgi:HTH-type transcriptional regulator/antitoxin HigA
MEIKPIRTKRDYEAALNEIERLMDAKRNAPEGDRLDVLVTLVEAYKAKHFPLDLPDPVEAIKGKGCPEPFLNGPRSRVR